MVESFRTNIKYAGIRRPHCLYYKIRLHFTHTNAQRARTNVWDSHHNPKYYRGRHLIVSYFWNRALKTFIESDVLAWVLSVNLALVWYYSKFKPNWVRVWHKQWMKENVNNSALVYPWQESGERVNWCSFLKYGLHYNHWTVEVCDRAASRSINNELPLVYGSRKEFDVTYLYQSGTTLLSFA